MAYSATGSAASNKSRSVDVEQRAEKIAALRAFANHGFKYGGSSSAIGAMKKREKGAKLELEADEAV